MTTLFFVLVGRSSRKNQKWRGPDENIRANLRQYGTERMYVDVMVSDASKPLWRNAPLFDAIITDRRSWIHSNKKNTKTNETYWKSFSLSNLEETFQSSFVL